MDKFETIRPVVLGIIRKDNKILVSEGYDKVKDQYFYRSLGGGIEFQENSKDALKREFKEELDIEIEVGKFLGISENIFVFNGKKAHELVLFYEANIKNEDYKEKYQIIDEEDSYAIWMDVNKFVNKELILYPEEVLEYLK